MKARTLNQPYDEAKLAADITSGVADVAKKQVEIGIDIPNDGEYSHHSFMTYFQERISGLESRQADPNELMPGLPWEREEFADFFKQHDTFNRYVWMLPEVSTKEL